MALRWSKTPGAYKKHRSIFLQPLPAELKTDSPISLAGVIRDVIRFAAENQLQGGNWYRKVTVSPEVGKVIIKEKKQKLVEITYPFESLFSLLAKIQEGTITSGYIFTSDTPVKRLNETLVKLKFKSVDHTMYLQLEQLEQLTEKEGTDEV